MLFVDADVRLQPATLRRALAQATTDRADLLSMAPRRSSPVRSCCFAAGPTRRSAATPPPHPGSLTIIGSGIGILDFTPAMKS